MHRRRLPLPLALPLAAFAVSASASALAVPAPAAPPPAARPVSAGPVAPPGVSAAPEADTAAPIALPLPPQALRLLKAEVLLDRAHFSPGVIDARDGGNLANAAAAWRRAHDGATGDLIAPLEAADPAPIVVRYTIAAQDVAGPFVAVPKDFAAMAKLGHLGYSSPLEGLAERFHAGEALLKTLNPKADFGHAGEVILVPAVAPAKLGATVATIEIDKARDQLRAFDAKGTLVAVYPATVGSTERPAPSGTWAVRTLAPAPTYTYDPSRLTFGKKQEGKLTIAAGPNNPVGSTWIALTKETYGIHGTPDPELVGKRASHGCVRLTNWDAAQLGAAVKAGTKVVFMGVERRKV